MAVLKEEPEEAEPGHWKKQYMWMMVGQEVNKWRRELRDLRADTGLPQETERILRYSAYHQWYQLFSRIE